MVTRDSSIHFQDNEKDTAREALLSRVLSPSPVFTLHGKDEAGRDSVEKFVATRFSKDYGAEIHEFMPDLLSMRCLNCFSGVIGMRRAATSGLFLEQYLDDSIEKLLSDTTGEEVARRQIIEIGNLVAGRKGPSQLVFLIATSMLHKAGYKWITFTATKTLANNLNKLGFPMVKLGEASVDRLPDGAAGEWGNYYRTQPCVYAGSLDGAMEIARRRPLFRKAMVMYRRCIRNLAKEYSRA